MAQQLVYTSAPKLLDAGRSGFGVVARSRSLPALAANAIERFSKFENLRGTNRARVIMAHRKVMIGSARLHVLSRIRDSGSDHTGRTNHIAHHLIFAQMEVRELERNGVTPADALAQFQWLDSWQGAPRTFEAGDDVPPRAFQPNFGQHAGATWEAVTGDGRKSRLIAWEETPRTGAWIVPDEANLLGLIGEALAECDHSWGPTFTTFLEGTDELSELDWIVLRASEAAVLSRVSSRKVFDLTKPESLPVPPPKAVAQSAQTVEPEPAYQHPAKAVEAQASSQSAAVEPIQVRTVKPGAKAAGHRSPSRATKRVATSNAARVWLYLGPALGVALIILVAAAIFGNRDEKEPGKDDPASTQAEEVENPGMEDPFSTLLVRAGETPAAAKKLAKMVSDTPEIEKLPEKLKDTIKEYEDLAAKWRREDVTLGELRTECRTLFLHVGLLPGDIDYPKEDCVCDNLAASLTFFREVWESQGAVNQSSDDIIDVIEKFRMNVEKAASVSDKFDRENVKPLVGTLWALELEKRFKSLDRKSPAEDLGAISRFVDTRSKFGIEDSDVERIYIMSGWKAESYRKILRDIGKENLLKKWLLGPAEVENGGVESTSSGEEPVGLERGSTKVDPSEASLPDLKDEEWCVAKPFDMSDQLRLLMPDSPFFQAVLNSDKVAAELEFTLAADDSKWRSLAGKFNSKMKLRIDEGAIRSDTRMNSDSLVRLRYRKSVLSVHLKKWPNDQISERFVKVKFDERNEESGLVIRRTIANGDAFLLLGRMSQKTIPSGTLYWSCPTIADGELIRFEPDSSTIVLKSEAVEDLVVVKDPGKDRRERLRKIIRDFDAEVSDPKSGKIKEEIVKDLKGSRRKYKKILDRYYSHLKNPDKEWLEERLKAENKEWAINHVSCLHEAGEKLHPRDAFIRQMLEDASGKEKDSQPPQLPRHITCFIKSAGNVVYKHKFEVQAEN